MGERTAAVGSWNLFPLQRRMRPLVWADPRATIGEGAQQLDGTEHSCAVLGLTGQRTEEHMNRDSVTELALEECWELLRAHAMGRLAFHLADQVGIAPINYVVDKGTLLFRTAETSKLAGVVSVPDIAFEIDGENGDTAWSVVVRGTAELLDERAGQRADDLALKPWVSFDKDYVVEITPVAITGRRFRLDPRARHPWLDG